MKLPRLFLVPVVLVTGLIMVPATGCTETAVTPAEYVNVTPAEASELIQENENNTSFIILDVRTPAEYDSGHLADAINIDVQSGHFEDDIAELDKADTYLVYCRSGRRSVDASERMIEQGFTSVYNMTSGINEWKTNGFPVVQ